MDRRKRQSPGGKYRRKCSCLGVWTLSLLVCAFLLITGGVLAKYITSNQHQAEMESSQFHISSNYLEERNATYTVTDWSSGFDILLFNYEKENIAQISGVDMRYQVTVTNAEVSVKDQNGDDIQPNEYREYTFQKMQATNTQHTLHITPHENAGASTNITVTVQTTSPYQKTLRADFTIQRSSKPDYTVRDQGDGTVLLTVRTNDYSGTVTVSWDPKKFSPDNTNNIMQNWKNEAPTGSFTANRGCTYALLFFKNTADTYNQSGTGTTVTLN